MSVESIGLVLDRCQAVIFDLDGVLADTEPLKFAAYQQVFRQVYGVELPESDVGWRGMKEQSVIEYWFDKFQLTGEVKPLVRAKREAYQTLLHQGSIPAVPGSVEFVRHLDTTAKRFGLATSSSRREATTVLDGLNLSSSFKVMTTRDEVQQLKPDPEVYLKTASALNVPPEDCMVFEDSQSGVKAAKAAGMFCIGLTTSFSIEALSQADRTIANFTELLNF
ncbi:MAG: HAD family phosphatase [Cyanobacteria bacterium SID2]|nr:HAD family phosphatase [Cyanobacteria bacterium SID2]MBP0005976.1 HAD family phosphatase [Cyanobacteria bacterium SBC]